MNSILGHYQFPEFTLKDLPDLMILTFIFYQIIIYLQGTRSFRILAGLVLMLSSFFLAKIFDMNGLSLVLEGLFSYFFIIVIVLFQSDIRAGLAKLGTGSLFNFKLKEDNDLAKIITECCLIFSNERTGALIVFEKKIGIKNLQAGGTLLNAFPSVHLIMSLFNKNVPLHDGAMIIDNRNLIRSMGAILPLSTNITNTPNFGTRHRAAIGISEESDAYALVISEQTGNVSIAFDGKLESIKKEEIFQRIQKIIQ